MNPDYGYNHSQDFSLQRYLELARNTENKLRTEEQVLAELPNKLERFCQATENMLMLNLNELVAAINDLESSHSDLPLNADSRFIFRITGAIDAFFNKIGKGDSLINLLKSRDYALQENGKDLKALFQLNDTFIGHYPEDNVVRAYKFMMFLREKTLA